MSKPVGRTLYDRLWQRHVVCEESDGMTLLYVDRHLLHEVTSPQAFAMLRDAGLRVRHPELCLATADHNVPTDDPARIEDPAAREQITALRANCRETGIRLLDIGDAAGGVIHVVAPEWGMTLPGVSLVCGDSHTATHGAFGALAFGIGTSEVAHVLATQTLWQRKDRTLRLQLDGRLPAGTFAKDISLRWMRETGAAGATGFAVEYVGPVVHALDMAGRMTLCNLSIEAGARTGLIAPDDITLEWLARPGLPYAPRGAAWKDAVAFWNTLHSDDEACFDRESRLELSVLAPQVTWGTSPAMAVDIDGVIPAPGDSAVVARADAEKALAYMDLHPGMRMTDILIDVVFIGSCTNGRIEDLRAAAAILRDRHIAAGVRLLVVPGSGPVRAQAEAEGIDRIIRAAGGEWRHPGCSMCLAMNADRVPAGQRCASTSNRNFEGRQGVGARTHLLSPASAAATAIAGHLADVRPLLPSRGICL